MYPDSAVAGISGVFCCAEVVWPETNRIAATAPNRKAHRIMGTSTLTSFVAARGRQDAEENITNVDDVTLERS